jgi:hypothetical protein
MGDRDPITRENALHLQLVQLGIRVQPRRDGPILQIDQIADRLAIGQVPPSWLETGIPNLSGQHLRHL